MLVAESHQVVGNADRISVLETSVRGLQSLDDFNLDARHPCAEAHGFEIGGEPSLCAAMRIGNAGRRRRSGLGAGRAGLGVLSATR